MQFRISNRQFAYLLPAVFSNLWLLDMGWLNTYWTKIKLSESMTTPHYMLFFFILAFSTGYFAIRMDRKTPVAMEKYVLPSSILTALVTMAIPFVSGQLFLFLFLLTAVTGGFFSAYTVYLLLYKIPRQEQSMAIGWSGALGTLLHLLIFSILLPQTTVDVLTIKTILGAVFMLFAGCSIRFLPSSIQHLKPANSDALPLPAGKAENPKILFVLSLILVCFFLSYGMQDFAATAHWLEGKGGLVFTRLFMAIGFLLGGVLWELKFRHLLVTSSFVLLLMGFICMGFEYRGITAFIAFSCVQLASSLFAVGVRIVLLDVAAAYQKPIFVSSLGLVLSGILKQLGILAALISYLTMGPMAIFVFSLLFAVLGLPFISLVFDRLGAYRFQLLRVQEKPIAATIEKEALPGKTSPIALFKQTYQLTNREEQVLTLSIQGLSITEMAGNLYVSEPTIKHYVRQILHKTGAKNQKQVLAMVYQDQSNTDS